MRIDDDRARWRRVVHALVGSLVVLGCACGTSSGDFICPSDRFVAEGDATLRVACQAAQAFAARDTAGLVPAQAEVDRYFQRWLAAVRAEPILDRRVPQRNYVGYGSPIPIYTMNAAVIDAWSQRLIETGDSAFDGIIMELTPPRSLDGSKTDLGNGWYLFALSVQGIFNEQLLDERLQTASSHTEQPRYPYNDNGSWSWQNGVTGTASDADVAQIDFSFGWGDCFVACDGMHNVRAVVPPDQDAKVYDLGGDPLPDGLELSPSTTPWPP